MCRLQLKLLCLWVISGRVYAQLPSDTNFAQLGLPVSAYASSSSEPQPAENIQFPPVRLESPVARISAANLSSPRNLETKPEVPSATPTTVERLATKDAAREGQKNFNNPEDNYQGLTLVDAVRSALLSRQIIRASTGTLNAQGVTIETISGYDPAILAQQVQVGLAQFDPKISGLAAANRIDRPPDSFFGPGLQSPTRRDEVELNSRISKEWASGGVGSVGYEPSLAYLFFPNGVKSGLNPTHSSDLVSQYKHPLLRGGDRDANLATILIAEQRVGQSRLDIEQKLQTELRSIEESYWQLHAAQVRQQAVEQAIVLARESLKIVTLRYEAKRVIYADVARSEVQLENFLQQQLRARNSVRQESLRLSQLMGLPLATHKVYLTLDAPVRTPVDSELDAMTTKGIATRPDLQRRRIEIAIQQQQIIANRNQLLPQLDLRVLHRSSGLNDNLGAAVNQMGFFEFNDWTVGLTYSATLGNRQAASNLRSTELQLARTAAFLQAYEQQVAYEIASQLNEVKLQFDKYESALRQVEQSQQWLKLARLRYEEPPLQRRGEESLLMALYDYQAAIQSHVDAVNNVADSLASYNAGLARLEEAQGTMLEKWRIQMLSE